MVQNLATDPAAQARYDEGGSWGKMSASWPSVAYTPGKLLLCTRLQVVPYGQYVVVGNEYISGKGYDYSKVRIRCATQELCDNLDKLYNEVFVECNRIIVEELAWQQ